MTRSDDGSEMDLNVLPVYASGITGKGINVVVLDDGFDWKHPDIRANYVNDTFIICLFINCDINVRLIMALLNVNV